MFTVYILRTSANTLYVGQTNNILKRLQEHKSKKSKAAKYTKAFNSITLVYQEQHATRSDAMKREYALKQLTHKQKEILINQK